MARLEYLVDRYHVEIGADGDSFRNNFVNLHLWLRLDPNAGSLKSTYSRKWDSLDRVVFQCTDDPDFMPTDKEDGTSAITRWRLMQQDRDGYSMVAALMPLERFPIVVDLLDRASEVRLVVFPQNHDWAYTTIVTAPMPVGSS